MGIKFLKIFGLFLFLSVTLSCDSHRHKKCEWYLVPEPRDVKYVEQGWVTLCAKNYVSKRQRCYLKMKIDRAERVYNKTVTFSSLKLGKGAIKEVLSYKECVPEQ